MKKGRKMAEATQDGRSVIGGLTITVVQRIHEPIYGGGTASIGEAIDEHLHTCAEKGMEVQKVEFEMEPQQWHELSANYRSS